MCLCLSPPCTRCAPSPSQLGSVQPHRRSRGAVRAESDLAPGSRSGSHLAKAATALPRCTRCRVGLHMCMYVYIYIYIHIYTPMRPCVYSCVRVCVCVCVFVCTYVYIYIYTTPRISSTNPIHQPCTNPTHTPQRGTMG